jgi:hypothetical protein
MASKEKNTDDVLKALLSVEDVPERDIYMPRFGVNFRIKAISGDLLSKLTERCTFYTGKGSNREKQLDDEKFGILTIAEACVVPNWREPQLFEKYGTKNVETVIKNRLLAGEIAKLAAEILDLSGFTDDEDDLKN